MLFAIVVFPGSNCDHDVYHVAKHVLGRALASLGFGEVQGVRLGKIIELDLDATYPAEARKRVESMCEKLLANTVIEEYRIEQVG